MNMISRKYLKRKQQRRNKTNKTDTQADGIRIGISPWRCMYPCGCYFKRNRQGERTEGYKAQPGCRSRITNVFSLRGVENTTVQWEGISCFYFIAKETKNERPLEFQMGAFCNAFLEEQLDTAKNPSKRNRYWQRKCSLSLIGWRPRLVTAERCCYGTVSLSWARRMIYERELISPSLRWQ